MNSTSDMGKGSALLQSVQNKRGDHNVSHATDNLSQGVYQPEREANHLPAVNSLYAGL